MARRTYSLRVIPIVEFVGIRRRFMEIEERVAVRWSCYDAVEMGTRHARICPRAGAQVFSTPAVPPHSLLHDEETWDSSPS